jgi:hypothetical protein
VGTSGLGAALHLTRRWVDDDRGCVPVPHFSLAPDLLEPVAARDEVLKDRS